MSYYNRKIFNRANLSEEDKRVVALTEGILKNVLSEDSIKEYVLKKDVDGIFEKILMETLTPFIDYLKGKGNMCLCDYMLETIEGYTPEEFMNITGMSLEELERWNED